MGDYKPYPAYKDSGIAWLGEIPAHWDVRRLKFVGRLKSGSGFPDREQGLSDELLPFYKVSDMNLTENEVLMQVHNNSISRETAVRLRAHVFSSGTIIFPKVGAALLTNKRRILSRPACIDNNTMGFIIIYGETKYIYYHLNIIDFKPLANPGAVPSVNESQIKEVTIAFPPLPEQRAIAAFLDRETAHLDALIAKKRELIDLLRRQRTAVISHAVTKGLDPSAPLKDSGIAWLGEIPAHWETWKIAHIFRKIGSGTTPPTNDQEFYDGHINWVTTSELRDNEIFETRKKVTQEALAKFSTLKIYPPGTLLIALYGATIGRIGLLKSEATTNQACCALVYPRNLLEKFAFYCLYASRDWIINLGYGGGQPNISQEIIRKLKMPVPPIDEQRAIAAYLDRETARIDRLIEKIEESIALLQRQRTALISAAVTGKIDVRERE